MTVLRPPSEAFLRPGFLLILISAFFLPVFSAAAGDLVLPDLVLPRHIRPDIPQPDIAAVQEWQNWEIGPPSFRRIYPLEKEHLERPEAAGLQTADKVDNTLMEEQTAGQLLPAGALRTDFRTEAQPSGWKCSPVNGEGKWRFEAGYNYRENSDVLAARSFPEGWEAGAYGQIPSHYESPRPYAAGLFASKIGPFSANLLLGGKTGTGNTDFLPLGMGQIQWASASGRADWRAELNALYHTAENKQPAGSLLLSTGIQTALPLDGLFGAARFETGFRGGGGAYQGLVVGGVSLGFRFADAALSLQGGLDTLYRWNEAPVFAPFAELLWHFRNSWIFYLYSQILTGRMDMYSGWAESERIGLFEAEIPSYYSCRAGLEHEWANNNLLRFSMEADYGRLLRGSGTALPSVIPAEDTCVKLDVFYSHGFSPGIVTFKGNSGYFLAQKLFFWETSASYEWGRLGVHIQGGSEDMYTGGGLPGLRGSLPIMGAGVHWNNGRQFSAALNGYTDSEFRRPSLELRVKWRSR